MPYATTSDGVRLYYEVYGSGEQTVFLLPTAKAPDANGTAPQGQVSEAN